MPLLRVVKFMLFVCAVFLFAGCAAESNAPEAPAMPTDNPITGEGLPNPAPIVTANWGTLPEGESGARPPVSTLIRSMGISGRMSAAARATSVPGLPSTATTIRWTRSSSSTEAPVRYSPTSAAASWSPRTASMSTRRATSG